MFDLISNRPKKKEIKMCTARVIIDDDDDDDGDDDNNSNNNVCKRVQWFS